MLQPGASLIHQSNQWVIFEQAKSLTQEPENVLSSIPDYPARYPE